MLVATPGQTTSYVLHAKKSCHNTNSNSSATGNNASPNSNSTTTKTARHVLANCVKSAAAAVISAKQVSLKLVPPSVEHTGHQISNNTTTTNNHTNNLSSINSSASNTNTTIATSNSYTSTNTLMKTLSVRLNRGTEFLKETVQKAFISKIPSRVNSVLNLYTVPPTSTHRFPAERLNVSSADSLHTEMCHFKPIRAEPKTPWKSNSKSRGASLKTPKACQATKVKLNCDDDSADDDYVQFKPKPSSTLLTTIVTTPTHQSAFVCLIAQMKTIQQSTQSNMELHKTKSNRFRTKSKSNLPVIKSTIDVPLNELILRKRRNPFVNVKKINIAAELLACKKRESCAAISITKAKSKSKIALAKSKSKLRNNLDNNNISTTAQGNRRKRKLYTCELTERVVGEPKIRKSTRQIQDCSREIGRITGRKSFARITKRQSLMQNKRAAECFSPPLTRSRLKQMSSPNLKLIPALEYRRRVF